MKKNGVISDVTPSDGNVFEDIGFEFQESISLKLKSDCVIAIAKWIAARKYTQKQAAQILRVNRPEVSDLKRGKIDKFSLDKLVNMLQRAGKSVRLEIEDHAMDPA